jgi:mannosyltransferase OCH1-like enzyme
MIPKKIHYCWFGGNPLPDSAKKCIDSWKKFCPDYEIIEWNESNFDVNCCAYVREAYQAKKWAFVSDVARLYIIAQNGGIYLDTDVELIKPLDSLMEYEGFMGFENNEYVALGLGFGAVKGNYLIQELVETYQTLSFIKEDGTYNQKPITRYTTETLMKHGLQPNGQYQKIEGIEVLSKEYLCPFDFETGKLKITPNTFSIHWFDATWFDPAMQYQKKLTWKLNKALPQSAAYNISRFIAIMKFRGIGEAFRKVVKKFHTHANPQED